MLKISSRGAYAALALLVAAGCGGDDGGITEPPPELTIQNYITAVKTLDGTIKGTYIAADAPTASGGPALTATGNATVIWGGSSQAALSAGADFTTVIVSIDGVNGHYSLSVPAGPDIELLLIYSTIIPAASFDMLYQVADDGGAVGDPVTVATDVIVGGTGVVQFNVSWDTDADVDLHIVDPSGEEIYWMNPESASGGVLDVMSNLNCVDESRIENVKWQTNALRGDYIVRVALASGCGNPETNYVVTVRMQDRGPRTFTGTLTTPTGTGQGDGVEVATVIF